MVDRLSLRVFAKPIPSGQFMWSIFERNPEIVGAPEGRTLELGFAPTLAQAAVEGAERLEELSMDLQ